MQDTMAEELLDIRAAAALLRVSPTSLRRWTNTGRLPCVRIGGRRERRFRRKDLLALLGSEGGPVLARPRSHFCGLYTSDLSRVREAAAFLAPGLQPHTLCVLAAGDDVQAAVIELLKRDHPAISRDVKAGRLELVAYQDSATAQLQFWRTRLRAALKRGISAVRVVGDVSGSALGRLPFAEVLEYEAEFDRSIAQGFPVTTLCQYDARRISGLEAAGLLRFHHAGPRHEDLSLGALAL